MGHWKVFKRGPWNSEIDWVGLDKLEHRCGGNPLDYEFVIDALVVVDNIRSRDNDLYLQKEYLSHANELEHFAYKTALENRTKGLFQIGSLIEKADPVATQSNENVDAKASPAGMKVLLSGPDKISIFVIKFSPF